MRRGSALFGAVIAGGRQSQRRGRSRPGETGLPGTQKRYRNWDLISEGPDEGVLMDAIEMLTNDHNRVRELFKKFHGGGGITGLVRRTVGSVSTRERQQALERVCTELEVHTRIEEEIFYPAVTALDDDELGNQVKEALREHAKVKQEVSHLKNARADEPGVEERMADLERDVEHHATEEEKEMFPRLDELMPEKERRELATRMRALKQRASGSKRTRSSSVGRKMPTPRPGKASGPARTRANPQHASHGRSKKLAQRGGKG